MLRHTESHWTYNWPTFWQLYWSVKSGRGETNGTKIATVNLVWTSLVSAKFWIYITDSSCFEGWRVGLSTNDIVHECPSFNWQLLLFQHFRFNTQLLICNGRLRYRKQCKYHLQVFGSVANTFYKCVRTDNCSNAEILDMDSIKPTLEMLEVLSLPTKTLISMCNVRNLDLFIIVFF